jgi:DNA polymerase
MEGAGSLSAPNGLPTIPSSCGSSRRCRDGTVQSLTSTGSITTAGIFQKISGWFRGRRIAKTSAKSTRSSGGLTPSKQRTRTYDLVSCGPRHRFTILTDAGPIIAHNCGTHTHRWSGGDKLNPQNFNRGGALREALLAPPGHVLVVADSGQIEARVVAWLAGDENLLDAFRRNDTLGEAGDFYSDVGSQFFKKKLSKKETPIERQLAKNMVLALGFGMGCIKFAGDLLKGMLGSKPVQFTRADAERYGVDVDAFANRPRGRDGETNADEVRRMISRVPFGDLLVHVAVADYFVRLYRESNPKIPALWKRMESVIRAMDLPEPNYRAGCLHVRRHQLTKPSGLTLHYPGLRETAAGWVYQGGKSGREATKIYGGLLTENVVQSLARDIVAEQMLWIRAEGYRIATCSHDEIMCVVPEAEGERCLAYMLGRMRIAPEWCQGLPLNASGSTAVRYGDAK